MSDSEADIIPIQAIKTVSKDVAEEQFESLLDYYGIEFSHIEIEDGPEAAATIKNMLVAAIMRGELEINIGDDGMMVIQNLIYRTDAISQITYTDKVAKARLAMDQVSPKKAQARMFAFMATMANLPVSELLKMRGKDISTFTKLSMIFSMV